MNKRLPYENKVARQLENVPLPDENMAWADMKGRLDEDDHDRFSPFWLKGCLSWTLLGVVLLTLGWWILRPEKWFERKNAQHDKPVAISRPREKDGNDLSQNKQTREDSSLFFETTTKLQNENAQSQKQENVKRTSRKEGTMASAVKKNLIKQNGPRGKSEKAKQSNPNDAFAKNKNLVGKTNQSEANKDSSVLQQHQIVPTDTVKTTSDSKMDMSTNSIKKEKNDSLTSMKGEKSKNSSPPKFSFAAGISLHQQLPVGGQKFVPYNSEGRKGTFADYIPSIYLRVYPRNKWFIQSEFRYGAPQYTKEFLYRQRVDSVPNGTITQSTSLKKTYYHQLPLTFDYFVSKNLSVGGGVVWNRFVSAISSQDIVSHNRITGADSLISKGTIIVSKTSDSSNVFVKSWFQALFEAEYGWNRFSVGARYAIGLEPYIKFELPGQAPQQETNSSLDIFIRYELWRSKKK